MKLTQEDCKKIIVDKLSLLRIPEADSLIVANVLLEAELRRDSSHGVVCISKIEDAVLKGDIAPGKQPEIIQEEHSTVLLDCQNVLGPVAGAKAVEIALDRAKKYGIAAVSLRNSHHLFTIGYYAKLLALNNMIGIVTTSTAPAIFAPGGLEKVLGTNPLAIAVPSESYPLVLDMSSTVVARGRVQEALKSGSKIPLDWAVDKEGVPTDDPSKALEGSLRAIGEYKGFGLALMIDILSSVLSGSSFGKDISGTSMHALESSEKKGYKGDLVIAIDPSRFQKIDLFKSRVSKLAGSIKSSGDDGKVRLPGESAYRNSQDLIEINDSVYGRLTGRVTS